MKDPLQMLAEDASLDPNLRQIFGGARGATVEYSRPRYAMTARKDDSRLILETTASTLCATDNERHMLQMCYDIGVLDGGIKAKEEALAKLAGEPK